MVCFHLPIWLRSWRAWLATLTNQHPTASTRMSIIPGPALSGAVADAAVVDGEVEVD